MQGWPDAEDADLVLDAWRMRAGRVADKAEGLRLVHRRPVLDAVAKGAEDCLGVLPEGLHHLAAIPAPKALLQRLRACAPISELQAPIRLRLLLWAPPQPMRISVTSDVDFACSAFPSAPLNTGI